MEAEAYFFDRLTQAIKTKGNAVCVGLDPRKQSLPKGLLPLSWCDETDAVAQAYRTFCTDIIDTVADLVPIVKPQMAFFEQLGPAGMRALKKVIRHARQAGLLVLLDGKRNDIGSTAKAYADAYLGRNSAWTGDALTINPYLGDDSLQPFVDVAAERGAGLFTLVKTSNPGGGMFQDVVVDGVPMYQRVAEQVERFSTATAGECGYGVMGAVVGATYPEQLSELRARMPHSWFLVPGFGSQGGTAKDVAGAFDANGLGAVVNSSRAIIFAHQAPEYEAKAQQGNWQASVEAATRKMIQELSEVS
jgi:orotidine-5'-phosphate decarboxylase